MRASPRCGARTRSGSCCALPCIRGRPRCRLHGGRHYCGAKVGNRNALKHGLYSGAERARRAKLAAFERWARQTAKVVRDLVVAGKAAQGIVGGAG